MSADIAGPVDVDRRAGGMPRQPGRQEVITLARSSAWHLSQPGVRREEVEPVLLDERIVERRLTNPGATTNPVIPSPPYSRAMVRVIADAGLRGG